MNIRRLGLVFGAFFCLVSPLALAQQKVPKPIDGATIIDGTVTTAEIADGSLTGADIAGESIDGSKIENGSLTGDDIDESTLVGVDAGTIGGVSVVELVQGMIASFKAEIVAPSAAAVQAGADPRSFASVSTPLWPFSIGTTCTRELVSYQVGGTPVYGIKASYGIGNAVDSVSYGDEVHSTLGSGSLKFHQVDDVAFWPYGQPLPPSGTTEKRARIDVIGRIDEATSTCVFIGLVTISNTTPVTIL